MESSFKRCRQCQQDLPFSAFGWQSRTNGLLRSSCRDCDAQADSLFGIEDEYEARRAARLFLEYGLTPTDEERLLVSQNGACATCGETPDGKRLQVDYVDDTGEIRGLLCKPCSRAVDWADTDLSRMQRTIKYLSLHQEGRSALR